jgi:GNAT superfamily N-acetyltransferase
VGLGQVAPVNDPEQDMPEILEVSADADVGAVADLARRIWSDHYVPIIGQAQVDYMLSRFQSAEAIASQIGDGYLYYLLLEDDRPAGYFAVLPHEPDGSMLMSKLYVDRPLRGRGLARAAVEHAEALCRQRDISRLWLTVNKNNRDSIAAYERMGFSNVGPTVQDIGAGFVMDDFIMEKRLAAAP